MSDSFFYNKFSTALLDIVEQIQAEQYPGELAPGGKMVSEIWACKDWMNYYVPMYVKYIEILRTVEDCYDQLTHPQMRKVVKKFLENILCRITQIKKEIIYFNNPITDFPGIPYIFLDDYIIDLKLEPDNLNIKIPRYFQEDFSDSAEIRRALFNARISDKYGNALPEEDVTKFPFQQDLNMEEAVKLLQNFEMGRQHVKRISKTLKLANKKVETDLGSSGGEKKALVMEDEKRKLVVERLIAVQKLKNTRESELKFLKMVPNYTSTTNNNIIGGGNTDKESLGHNLQSEEANNLSSTSTQNSENLGIKIAEENRKHRKTDQKGKEAEYELYKKELEKNIIAVEKYDIKQAMINERKDWMDKYKFENKEPAHSLDLFYNRFEFKGVEKDDGQKKMAEQIAKEKLKKEQDKKKADENGAMIKRKN